ncbi:MAG: hypothetical protein SFZ23_09340 [Planctomycetota bacterium]|nr:hypothetical protein [Planctomycetota bacterium]
MTTTLVSNLGPETRLFLSVARKPGRFGAMVYAELFRRRNVDAVYIPRVAPSTAPELVQALRALSVSGCSVSSPHKGGVIDLLDEVDPLARRAGAVNTIVRRGSRLIGACTDVAGVIECLAARSVQSALIFGAGGVVGPAIIALRELGCRRVALTGRRPDAVAEKARAFGVEAVDAVPAGQFDVLINATPVGETREGADDLFRCLQGLSSRGGVLDMPVTREPTAFVREAQARGSWAATGVDMCAAQLAPQASLYLDAPVTSAEVRDVVERTFLA